MSSNQIPSKYVSGISQMSIAINDEVQYICMRCFRCFDLDTYDTEYYRMFFPSPFDEKINNTPEEKLKEEEERITYCLSCRYEEKVKDRKNNEEDLRYNYLIGCFNEQEENKD